MKHSVELTDAEIRLIAEGLRALGGLASECFVGTVAESMAVAAECKAAEELALRLEAMA